MLYTSALIEKARLAFNSQSKQDKGKNPLSVASSASSTFDLLLAELEVDSAYCADLVFGVYNVGSA
jgi:hypothetical protein